MKALYDLKEKLQDELEEIAHKPEMGAGDLDLVHKLTDTIKNIDKICMLEEGGHSHMDEGGRNSYDDGNSYRKHYVRGHYSRENGRGYSRGGYSRDGGKDQMMDQLEDMLNDAGSEKERQAIQRCISQLENA